MTTKPTIKKTEPKIGNQNELYQSAFEVPEQVKKEIQEAGLVCRWINAKTFKEQFGFHKHHWMPFKSKYMASLAGSIFGGDPEGYVRRGDLILAAKSKELQDKHRAHIDAQNRAKIAGVTQESQRKQMREIAREHGVKNAKIEVDEDEE